MKTARFVIGGLAIVAGEARGDNPEVTTVQPGKMTITVSGRSAAEPANPVGVVSRVEGYAAIVSILPEGSQVKKNDLVCELDSTAFKDRYIHQIIATEKAHTAYQNAKLTREVAEIALGSYESGESKLELNRTLHEVDQANSAIRRTEARLERTRQARQRLNEAMAAKDRQPTPADIAAALDVDDRLAEAESALDREKLALRDAETMRDVFLRFTKTKRTRELQSDIHRATAEELSREQTWDPRESFPGKVEDVSSLPDPRLANSDRTVYTAHVRLGREPANLLPGLSATTEFFGIELDNVLSVPASAIVRQDGRDYLFVRDPGGTSNPVEVTTGDSKRTHVEIRDGLRAGDEVIVDPHQAMSLQEIREWLAKARKR